MGMPTLDRYSGAEARDPRSDGDLLRQFASQSDHEAFERLLERHGPYLVGVCRRMTAHVQDAEDVFQACFLELVRNAASISRGNSVAGWLQTVAVRLARKARAQRARRNRQEATGLATEAAVAVEDVSWREVRQVL